ncbi:MAG: hypothetical protein A4E57_01469 [Syntrophorhabdaceae bacterium PtaU1.Bin034]|jgi:hypothetical protein|nr:MAG: hypothetical protein A4E57_01469 [Syntrophorhabdaceae bacterium PtaU1.Bin034]
MMPEFPQFKPIELDDREFVQKRLWEYQPETSELNFTNLFIWRSHYKLLWSVYRDWLLIISENAGNGLCALPPVGVSPRMDVTQMLLQWMTAEKGIAEPAIDRADRRLVSELEKCGEFVWEPTRNHFDYVYRTQDLVELAGKNYRAKRNHINYLLRSYKFTYEALNESHVDSCLGLAENWCDLRRCKEDLNLLGEWDATREALTNFRTLGMVGGVIIINGQVQAFTLGELLNERTAVVHIEKASSEIRGLYPAINQQFCEKQWQNVPCINREQDLGEPGLREAKLSYNPENFVEKFRVRLK